VVFDSSARLAMPQAERGGGHRTNIELTISRRAAEDAATSQE